MRIKVCWVGRTHNAPIRALLSDYLDRLKHLISLETLEVPDFSKRRGLKGAALLAAEAAQVQHALGSDCRKVVLEERGRQFSSVEFADWIESERARGTKEIAFIIGGPGGIDPSLLQAAQIRLSLGKMTWTHEMTRVLLLEQIYRAVSILRNLPYHK